MQENSCNEKVFDQIFRDNSRDINAFLHHKFGAAHGTADMVQEAFLALWRNCAKVIPAKARAYLFTVAQNMTLKQIRKSKSAEKYISEADKNLMASTPQDSMEYNEFSSALDAILNQLSEKQRIAFMLYKVEGKKHKEIAAILGISQKAVEKRIYTAAEIIFNKLGKKI